MRPATKKSRIREYAASRGWSLIGEAEWMELRASLPDISEASARGSGIAIAQPWLGVVQHSLDDLRDSLLELSKVYTERPDLQRYCRDQVITAKDRARGMSAKKPVKTEMVEWMLVWLDDPSVCPQWVQIRIGVKNATSAAMSEEHRIKCDVCSATGRCTECKGTGNGGQCFNCAGTGNCPQCQGSGRREVEKTK
jgi:hypothetical protein